MGYSNFLITLQISNVCEKQTYFLRWKTGIDRKFQLQGNACLSQPNYSFPAIYIILSTKQNSLLPLKWLNYVEVLFLWINIKFQVMLDFFT